MTCGSPFFLAKRKTIQLFLQFPEGLKVSVYFPGRVQQGIT